MYSSLYVTIGKGYKTLLKKNTTDRFRLFNIIFFSFLNLDVNKFNMCHLLNWLF